MHSFSFIWFMKRSFHVLPFPSKNGWISKKWSHNSLFVIRLSLKLPESIYRLVSTHHHGKYRLKFIAYPAGLTLIFLNPVLFFPNIKLLNLIKESAVRNISPSSSHKYLFCNQVPFSYYNSLNNCILFLLLEFLLLFHSLYVIAIPIAATTSFNR